MNNIEITIEELLEHTWLELDYLIREGITDEEMRRLQAEVNKLTERIKQGLKDNALLRAAVQEEAL